MRRFFTIQGLRAVVVCGLVAFAAGTVRADTATFGPVQFNLAKKKNVSKDFGPVTVTKAGKIKVKVEWHTSGFLPNDPNIEVRAELIGPSGSVVPGATKTVVLGHQMKTTTIEHNVKETELTGSKKFKVRLRAVDNTNAMDFEGKVTITYPIATVTLPLDIAGKFHLDPGNTEDRTFKLNPESKGRLDTHATWQTDLLGGGLLNPRPLRIRLFNERGDMVKEGKGMSPLNFHYDVQQKDLVGANRWRLQIHDPNTQGLDDVAVRIRFTPK